MTRQTIPLTTFTLCDAEPGSGIDDVRRRPESDWLPAPVPGGVHEALLAAGRIADPYFDRNEVSVRWVEERDWWFRAMVPAASSPPGGRTLLVCRGLDTVADLWLDGQPLGHSENMFRPSTFDVTGRLDAAAELLICFRPPLAGLTPPAAATNLLGRLGDALAAVAPEEPAGEEGAGIWSATLPLATLRRKATFSWGWDFGPRLPSIGPWRPVEVVQESGAVLSGHHVRTERVDVARRTADLTVRVEATQLQEDLRPVAEVELVASSGKITSLTVPLASEGAAAQTLSGAASVRVADAELWWTHDLGGQPRYQVTVRLRDGERLLDEQHDLVGLRTIALDRSSDPEGGRYFRFVLNGIPIFARGAAWLPANMLVGSVDQARYRDLLTTARDGQMTMLRIWGGGIYEHDTFYSLCDELGLLIWQDFAFACIDYPDDDPRLRTEVEQEAAHQVRRLRNHACLALWCGNNEVQMIHVMGYRDLSPGGWGSAFFDEMLPAVVATHDGGVPYWPGSPYGEPVDDEDAAAAINGVLDGDRHAWEVWHGMDFGAGDGAFDSVGESRLYRRYAADQGKFISEFGIHASPELSTLRRWLPDDQLQVHGPGFDHHNKDHPKNKHDPVLEIVTGLPSSMQQYVDFTMISQAEGLKFGIEHYRRRQPHCSGTLIWQFNDVWPGFSWSVVDYAGVPKAGYHYARRAYAPVIATFCQGADGELQLWICNSSAVPVSCDAEVTLARFSAAPDLVAGVVAEIEPAQTRLVWSVPGDAYSATAGNYAWVRSPSGAFAPNRYFFAEIKDMDFGPGRVESEVIRTGADRAVVRVRATGFNYFIRIPTPAPEVRFSDNYLDLRDGELAEIAVRGLTEHIGDDQLRAISGWTR
ncbi:MAG TPA: beta-mannosidase [Propionibacteriaceae bacterium]|nr:beta-mannosidase [Propionibacteriaceae bacterium]